MGVGGQVGGVRCKGIGAGTEPGSGGQRESGGQDSLVIDLKDELQQETDIQQPQQVDTRPTPKWFRSIVQDSR